MFRHTFTSSLFVMLALTPALADVSVDTLKSLSTPETVESRLGPLTFKDGAPDEATRKTLYDTLDFTHAFNAFLDTMAGVSIEAARQGLESAGVKENEVIIFSELMDASSLFLTANADTVYVMGVLDLTDGPMVLEVPPRVLGTIDDHWFRWVIDIGQPGPDRGEGGKYLIVPPGHEGPLPEGGYFIAHAKTNKVLWFARAFLKDGSDPKPAADTIRANTRVYRYEPGGLGTSIAAFLAGDARLGRVETPPQTVFHEGSGLAFNTVPPTDASFFALLDDVVQQEPATSLDPELMGALAAIGIEKGKPFAPDARMKGILEEAAAAGNAASRTLFMHPRDPSWFYYPDSAWWNFLFQTGYQFETPIPEITAEGAKPYPPTGYRTLDARTSFFYGVTGITPAMAMRLPGIGSQYLVAMLDADKNYLDGAATYKVTLLKGIPEANFWSLTLYDNQTRSMLQTSQKYPRAGSQSYPSPAAEAGEDGATTVWFAPEQPEGVARGNWIETDPERGFFIVLRLYSPLEPFFDKSWRPSEIERLR